MQHASLALLKEMLATLDVAQRSGNAADRKAADRLQRRHVTFLAGTPSAHKAHAGTCPLSLPDSHATA